MADLVECMCVLKKSHNSTSGLATGRSDWLGLVIKGVGFVNIPMRPLGEDKRRPDRPNSEWEYEIICDGRLHIKPSLLIESFGFHTAFDWYVQFQLCPEDVGLFEQTRIANQSLDLWGE